MLLPSDESEKRVTKLVDHIFRHQSGRLVSTLTRIFGTARLDLAEEIVQDTLLKALQQWSFGGIPENPVAWLVQVAKNRALDLLRRETLFQSKSNELLQAFAIQEAVANKKHNLQLSTEILDDELSMIFMACHPSISRESRIALTLKTIGGFGVSEIARAFLTKEATIAQRLVRAKRRIIEEKIKFELPDISEMSKRLDSVLEVIYLLFNEGYTAHSGENLVRKDLCDEAIRLGQMLVQHKATSLPKSYALMALMFFQTARLPSRQDEAGELFLLSEQNRSLWDKKLISLGFLCLEQSSSGEEITEYHLQAAIAACHAAVTSYELTDWQQIVTLYDQLLKLNPSPVVALNRVVAIAKWQGADKAIAQIEEIKQHPALTNYYLLPATLGYLWQQLGDSKKAVSYYQEALVCNCSEPERRFLMKKLVLEK